MLNCVAFIMAKDQCLSKLRVGEEQSDLEMVKESIGIKKFSFPSCKHMNLNNLLNSKKELQLFIHHIQRVSNVIHFQNKPALNLKAEVTIEEGRSLKSLPI